MFTTKIIQHGTVFHDYAILRDGVVLYSFRADPREAQAVNRVFELVEMCAKRDPHPFPFAIIHNPDHTAVLCGPKDQDLKWGPVLEGPVGVLENLLPALMESFHHTQNHKSKYSLK